MVREEEMGTRWRKGRLVADDSTFREWDLLACIRTKPFLRVLDRHASVSLS